MPDCLDPPKIFQQGLNWSDLGCILLTLLQSTLLTNLLSGEPEVMPRNELVQDVGRADEAPGLPGEHAGGKYEGG